MKRKINRIIIFSAMLILLLSLEVFAAGFDFSVLVNPKSASVVQGKTASAQVTVLLLINPAKKVALSSSGCPAYAACSFEPSYGNPKFASTFKVATSPSTPPGVYSISIKGTGGGLMRTSYYTLTVKRRYY